MGFQDRDYYREYSYSSSYSSNQPHSTIFKLILLNVVIWLLDVFSNGEISRHLALRTADFVQPLQWYRFLTYAFCHSVSDTWHIIGNMLGLFFLGKTVEARYGGREFLFFYLFSAVVGGIYWSGMNYWQLSAMQDQLTQMQIVKASYVSLVGASGAVTATVILFTMNFPKTVLYIWGILPMPAFVFGILLVLLDLAGSRSQSTNVAHSVHLAGAVFAALYFVLNLRFCSIFGYGRSSASRKYDALFTNQSNYDYEDEYEDEDEDDSYGYASASPTREQQMENEEFLRLQAQVETLLKKISEHGMQSLTPEEMQTLRTASQKYREHRR